MATINKRKSDVGEKNCSVTALGYIRIRHIHENLPPVYCVRFSPNGDLLAVGCGDSTIYVFGTAAATTNKAISPLYVLHNENSVVVGSHATKMPVTSLRFRPNTGGATKNVLMASYASGEVRQWHITSGQVLSVTNEDNQIFAIDYRDDAKQFVTAGRDPHISLYDSGTKQLIKKLKGGATDKLCGHSNQIFATKFHTNSAAEGGSHCVLSGGWDNTVQVWDLRSGKSERSMFGMHVCGDSLDIIGHEVLVGSWQEKDNIQIWDLRNGGLIHKIDWGGASLSKTAVAGASENAVSTDGGGSGGGVGTSYRSCKIYAAQFGKGDSMLLAGGGCHANETRVFERTAKASEGRLIGRVTGFSNGVYSLDFSKDNSMIALAGADASVVVCDVQRNSTIPLSDVLFEN